MITNLNYTFLEYHSNHNSLTKSDVNFFFFLKRMGVLYVFMEIERVSERVEKFNLMTKRCEEKYG